MTQRIFQLEEDYLDFPDPELASTSPNGLLAIGGDLSPQRLINAYSSGIFPWFGEAEPYLWWSPDPRAILELDDLYISKSLAKFMRKRPFKVTLNHAFEEVIEHCAYNKRKAIDGEEQGTWITEEMIEAYIQLHQAGFAHSVEVWQQGKLVGGLYGISVGKLFCGESMFHLATNASKVAFSALVKHLKQQQFELVDCQIQNPHLQSLGSKEVSRSEFLQRLSKAISQKTGKAVWNQQELSYG